MDRACLVSWRHCYKPGELSAIQHAYNILIDDGEEVFASEYQQTPMEAGEKSLLRLTPDQIAGKVNQLARGIVPKLCQYVSAYVDVHRLIHYWVVSAWEPQFGGGPIDYGVWPEQPTTYFAETHPPVGLDKVYGGVEDSWVLAGLTAIVDALLAREWRREDGATVRIGKLLIDARYKTELVRQFCRRHAQAGLSRKRISAESGDGA